MRRCVALPDRLEAKDGRVKKLRGHRKEKVELAGECANALSRSVKTLLMVDCQGAIESAESPAVDHVEPSTLKEPVKLAVPLAAIGGVTV